MATDWQMPRPGRMCAGCEHAFEIGETLRAYLYETPAGYQRRDYCQTCRSPAQPAPLGTWKTCRPAPPPKKGRPFDREAIYNFFLRLEEADTPEKAQFRFVLALLLWRKKVLKFERSLAADAGECWEFRVPGSDERHLVWRPDLDEEQLERLSSQLEQLLVGEPGELGPTAAAPAEEQADG